MSLLTTNKTTQPVYRVKLKVSQRLQYLNILLNVNEQYSYTRQIDFKTSEPYWQSIDDPDIKFSCFGTEII
jgi:hypothetical protein